MSVERARAWLRKAENDLLSLLEMVKGKDSTSIPEDVTRACLILNPYAIEVRYPDDAATPTLEDAREARNSAQAVLDWIRKSLANHA